MTRLIFIRHAATDCFQDRVAGRNADVHLSAAGKFRGNAWRLDRPNLRRVGEIEQWCEFNLVRSCTRFLLAS